MVQQPSLTPVLVIITGSLTHSPPETRAGGLNNQSQKKDRNFLLPFVPHSYLTSVVAAAATGNIFWDKDYGSHFKLAVRRYGPILGVGG